jgi:hypothetical protein
MSDEETVINLWTCKRAHHEQTAGSYLGFSDELWPILVGLIA